MWILVWTHTPFVAIYLVSVFMKTSSQDLGKTVDKKIHNSGPIDLGAEYEPLSVDVNLSNT